MTAPTTLRDPATMSARDRQRELARILLRGALRLRGRDQVPAEDSWNPLDDLDADGAPCAAAVDGAKSRRRDRRGARA